MILKAAQFADACHRGQFRKYTGVAYIHHPSRVAARTMMLPDVPEYAVAAAWLHDVLEDCDVTMAQLDAEFGKAVTVLVLELTNPSKGLDISRADRKQMDRDHLRRVSYWAKVIKALDRIDNLREMEDAPADFKRLYGRESVLLGDVLLAGYSHDNLLRDLVSELYSLAITLRDTPHENLQP